MGETVVLVLTLAFKSGLLHIIEIISLMIAKNYYNEQSHMVTHFRCRLKHVYTATPTSVCLLNETVLSFQVYRY